MREWIEPPDVISIHAPRMGSDCEVAVEYSLRDEFQSTLPGWGATKAIMAGFAQGLISIHAPRMGSDVALAHAPPVEVISIHAPRMGSDMFCNMPISECASFQSTLPGWGATRPRLPRGVHVLISIHAPRMGSDMHWVCNVLRSQNFNPRSPDGERPAKMDIFAHDMGKIIHFQH